MAKTETYGIVRKGTYRIQISGTDREWVFSGREVLKMINEWREEIADNWQNRPSWPVVAPELLYDAALSIHPVGRSSKKGPPLTLHQAVCDLDLDTNPLERKKWKENDWRAPEGDDRYVRLYRSPTNAIRPILCKTITYTITRER